MAEFIRRVRTMASPPQATKEPDALRIGILGAARIAPDALIKPARSHPGIVVAAVAARDERRAQAFAKTHGIEKVFNSYQQMLDDPTIDAVYNPLPNGLHYEWTAKAIAAGKHVLLEKPSCNTAAETRKLFDAAREKGVVLLEAFHYRFHPAAHRLREIVRGGEIGKVVSVDAALAMPGGLFSGDDIRYNYSLGGGALMDMGTYTVSAVRFLTDAEPTSVTATHVDAAQDARVDRGITASLEFSGDLSAEVACDLAMPARLGFLPRMPRLSASVKGDAGEVTLYNFILPTMYHYIQVKKDGKTRTEKVYLPPAAWNDWPKAETWWSTYRYQLEAFVTKVKGGTPHHWMDGDDSVRQMEAIEKIYEKSGLGVRPASEYVP